MRGLLVVVSTLAVWPAKVDAQSLPGTADDPAELLRIWPAAVDLPLGGFAVRGGTEADTVTLVDGFEVPRLQHLGVRAILPSALLADGALRTAPEVSVGRAPSAVTLSTGRSRFSGHAVEANTFEGAARSAKDGDLVGVRYSTLGPVLDLSYFDMQARAERRLSRRWRLWGSGVQSDDRSDRDEQRLEQYFLRSTLGVSYESATWRGAFATSFLLDTSSRTRELQQHRDLTRVSFDTRGEIVRAARTAGGLTSVEWRLGEQTNIARHDIDVAWPLDSREGSPVPQHRADTDIVQRFTGKLWTPDAAVWTSIAANLAPHVRATAGVRADMFGRGGDVATQPRGELQLGLSSTLRFALAAGAYRRPPQQYDELLVKGLHPERTTQVMARLAHEIRGLIVQASTYYQERSRLVIRDVQGNLSNSGLGTGYGIELSAQIVRKRWLAWATASLARAWRRDTLPSLERPAEHDQPVRATAMVSRALGRWRLGARVQLASGLPVTSIQQSIYDADRDAYEPIFASVYDQRMPFRYEVDLRIERAFRISATARLDAYADVALSPSTLRYHYSFDYKQREAITLPIIPFVGLRGEL